MKLMKTADSNNREAHIYTVARCLNELIVNTSLDAALQNIVEWLAEFLQIDRCYILENNEEASRQIIFSSSYRELELAQVQYENVVINTSLFPEIHEVLQNRRSFKVSINNNISEELYLLLIQSKLQSLLLIPVYSGDRLWGSIGFGDTTNTRTWRTTEVELQSLAEAIGSAIESNRLKKEINAKNDVYNATLSSLNEIVWELDLITKEIKFAGSQKFLKGIQPETDTLELEQWVKDFVHKDDKERVRFKHGKFLLDKDKYTDEDVFRVKHKETLQYFWMHVRCRVTRGENKVPLLLTGTCVDLTDTKEVAFELDKQREQHQFLVESLGQVIFNLDKDGKCSFLSNAWNQVTGFTQQESLGIPFLSFVSNDHVKLFWIKFGNLLRGAKSSFNEQLQLVHKNGEKTWVRILAKSTRDFNNKVNGVFGTIENINHKYSSELLLHESSEKLKTILNSSKEIILTLNLERNQIENVNDAIALLGYKPEEWIGKDFKTWNDGQRNKFHELMKLAVKSELQVKNQHISFMNKANTESIPFEFSTSLFFYKNEKFLLCVLRDIRERLAYEENIKTISTQLTHLIASIDDVYAIWDIKTDKYEFLSDKVEELYGHPQKAFFENKLLWKEVIDKEDIHLVEAELQRVIATKGKGEIFYKITTPSGEKKIIFEKSVLAKDGKGNPDKIYFVKTDYTNVEKAKQSLIESEKKFRFISENISDFISIHDPDWNFSYASPAIKNILGYEPNELLNKCGFDLVHPDELIRIMDDAIEPIVIQKKEAQFRYRMLAQDGSYKWVETYSKPVIDDKGEISSIISSTRDVTDQVNAEHKLKYSEEQYRLLSENSNDVIAIHNLTGEYSYVSPSSIQVLGYHPGELLGKRPCDILAKDEESKTSAEKTMKEILLSRKTLKSINKIFTKQGKEKTLEVWVQPIFKENELVGIQATSRDVTEREMLLQELEHSLEKERELNELRSMFVSTASHQFRTPLTVIQSGVELMEMYIEDLPQEKQHKFQRQFKKMETEIERLEYLMNDVLVLGRANAARTPFKPETADLVAFCADIIENKYNNRFTEERKVILSVKGNVNPVDFDTSLLGHSIENIISNAYKYSEEGNLLVDLDYTNDNVTISITDHGIGIPEEDQKNLFQPFYRANNTSDIEGTGLGLSIVKEFVDKHNGKIFLNSKLNKGTTVCVIIPLKQNKS